MDTKDLNIQNYSIPDIFDILEIENGKFKKALDSCDDYIEHFDSQSNEVMTNFFLQIKDKLQEHVSTNNINLYNFDDIYETHTNDEPSSYMDEKEVNVGNLRERLEQFGENNDDTDDDDNNYDSSEEVTLDNNDGNNSENVSEEINTSTINNVGTEYNSNNKNVDMYMLGFDDGNLIYNNKKNETASYVKEFNKLDGFDKLNRVDTNILKQNMIFDSQFRPLGSNVNDFHIDLTEPLIDVLSIELLYYQFIYSIYNIDVEQNTSHFYITDITGELYTIHIESGLYKTPQSIIDKLNSSVISFFYNSTTFSNDHPDLSENLDSLIIFSYNELTGKTTIKIRNCFKYIKFFDLNIETGNAKLNYNLGYFLGFRKNFKNSQTSIGYYLIEQQGEGNIDIEVIVDNEDPSLNVIVSTGIVDIQNPKYLTLSIDDYNQNRLTQNVITASEGTDNTVSLRTINRCNENDVNNLQIPSNPRTKPLSLLYAHNERVIETINELKKQPSRNIPAAIQDVFAMIPIETERKLGELISNRGISTQINIRQYFGPVNINRFRIRLFDEKGNLVNLNNSDYSFTIGIEKLYNKNNNN
jgi:hypothetical protein